jgi:Tc5 transposase DNA-binding domain
MKRKMKFVTNEFRVKVLDNIKLGETVRTMSLKHDIPERTIRDWVLREGHIRKTASECCIGHKNSIPPKYPQLEKLLVVWALSQRNLNTEMTATILKEKAMLIYDRLLQTNPDMPDFTASDGWYRGFKSRYGLKILKPPGEEASVNKIPPVEDSSEASYEVSDEPMVECIEGEFSIDDIKLETQDSDVTQSDVEEEEEYLVPSPPRKKIKRTTNRDNQESTKSKDANLDNILKRLEIENMKLDIKNKRLDTKNKNLDIERKKHELYNSKLMIQHTKLLIKKAQADLGDIDNNFEDDPLTDEL